MYNNCINNSSSKEKGFNMKLKKIITFSAIFAVISMASVFAAPQPQKIAVVDIQKVVAASSQVKALKKTQEARNKELTNFIKNAQADVNKQTDAKKKKSLAQSYEKQLASKREAYAKDYAAKLKAADADITAQISKKATELGYTMVLPKSGVICGGDDITATVLKVIK